MNSYKKIETTVPPEEFISCGHTACAGCGERLALNFSLKALGKKTIIVVPASCSAVVDGLFPTSATKVPLVHNTFESTASVASGISRALKVKGIKDTKVLAWAGDGGTYDIGLQALSASAERNENMVYICYDNEAHMNTGVQRSSATPAKTWTMTTPQNTPKKQPKKDIMGIMASHYIPYIATASIAFPNDLVKKVNTAKSIEGFSFILIFSPCPTGWRYNPEDTVKIGRLAVETNLFPLYEVYDGVTYHIYKDGKHSSIEEYVKLQKRFFDIDTKSILALEKEIEVKWKILLKKEELFR